MESSSSRKVVFPDKLTFMLASKEEGGGQRFRCAKIVSKSAKEITLETFTQSQCYRFKQIVTLLSLTSFQLNQSERVNKN